MPPRGAGVLLGPPGPPRPFRQRSLPMSRPHPLRPTMLLAATSALLLLGTFAAANILKATNDADSWRFEQHGTAKGTMTVSGEELIFDVTEIDDTVWHVQA